ncbi:MAG: diaminopimelate epimerase [Armatimonadetes bacterium]|nr:diaminopimelate epimerase [Armatimonadota bacterium]
MANRFAKSHALGNDYIVMEPDQLSFALTPERIRTICHRNFGVGSDGILALVPSARGDVGMRIFNPDGSEAEKSGNGLRIFARYVWDHGHVRKPSFVVDTPGGLAKCDLLFDGDTIREITVDMGAATFRSDRIPAAGAPRDVLDEEIEADGAQLWITAVNVGNPHCVVFHDDLEKVDFHRFGPALENHAMFPHRTNVQFAQVLDRGCVRIKIWERGAGETLASGSSASAVAAACVRHGVCDGDVAVLMDGGTLRIQVSSDFQIRMTGPSSPVYVGELTAAFVASL